MRPSTRSGPRPRSAPEFHSPENASRPVRVLLIAPSTAIVGGQSVQAERLRDSLRANPSVAIDFLPINAPFPGALAKLQSVKYLRTVLASVIFNDALLRRVQTCDVVHTFTASYTSYLLWAFAAIVAAQMFRKKVVVNYRDGQAEDHAANWRTALSTLRLADAVVTPSEYLVDVFASFGLRAQCIYNIIDAERFIWRDREMPRPIFLHNRMLEPLYNVDCTLRAFAIVQQRHPEARLVIAHNGPSRAMLEKLAGKLRLRNVEFIGHVPQSDMPKLYDSSDIYLMSPDFDCMPGSVLECYASGLPVVASAAGGIPYIVRDEETGLLFPPGDHERMAIAALRLLQEPGLGSRLAWNGLREVRRYDATIVSSRWADFYRELGAG